jgi:single-stranded-DNA-specific exonuclease
MEILKNKPFSFVEKFNIIKDHVSVSIPDVEAYVSNDLKTLPNFSDLIDIDKATDRIIQAINSNQKIGVYGDYDVDGATSVATMFHFFNLVGFKNVVTYQPNRFVEGYGLHKSSIEQALKDGVELLITVDCGIMNHEASKYAKEMKLDLIITDHHKDNAELELPCALAVVNPNRSDQKESELKNLSGAGVAFAICHELRKKLNVTESIYPLLQFVAMSTIADMVKLCPMNAKFIRHGLSQFRQSKFVGIQELTRLTEAPIDEDFIGFTVGPMINAKGRLESPQDALRILISDNEIEVIGLIEKLKTTNEERKKVQQANSIIVRNKIKKDKIDQHNVMVVFNKNLHQGVVGLLASDVMKRHQKPAIVLTKDSQKEGVVKGSARSLGSFDIFGFLSKLDFEFLSFGGHKKAGGLSFKEEKLQEFIDKVNTASAPLTITLDENDFIPIEARMLDLELVGAIRAFAPYGMGNPRPSLSIEGNLSNTMVMKDKHLKIWFDGIRTPIILFNYFENGPRDIPNGYYRVLANASVNYWRGEASLNLIGSDLTLLEEMKSASGGSTPRGGFAPDDIAF